ncbi:DUF4368 domain-containing protein [Oscillibacter sp.]|nr:DUF4368 domain-containing protein [Oscillibacter sp.]
MWQHDKYSNTFVPGVLPSDGSQITACYTRLSQEDEQDGDSGSILNQRDFLLKYCTDLRLANVFFFSDDGYSGVSFDRPGFKELMDLVEQGRVKSIIVKDHSRLGRNRLAVGLLMERFEDSGVRYIAVADGIDSEKGLDDMVAVRELFNEFYPRDTSKKIRAVLTSKGNSGQRLCTQVPYGYTGNKYGWEVDDEAAQVVREIFRLCMNGLGPMQIAKRLKAAQILTPTAYKLQRGYSVPNHPREDPFDWDSRLVAKILDRMEYLGCTVNFKTRKKSYKSKKTLVLPPEERKVFENTHPAIIDRETWERVQELRKNKRRPTKTGRQSMFSGLLYCADCGAKLHYCTTVSFEDRQNHFVCSNYKSNTGTCSAHFIREVILYDIVLADLRDTIAYVRDYEQEFAQAVMDKSYAEQRKTTAQKRRELDQAQRRIPQLDTLFQRLYEDNVSGKLSDERYSKLAKGYEDEQRELTERVKVLQAELDEAQGKAVNLDRFISLVHENLELAELTPKIVNEFIRRIIVYAPDKSSGKRTQKVKIIYNLIGDVPKHARKTA